MEGLSVSRNCFRSMCRTQCASSVCDIDRHLSSETVIHSVFYSISICSLALRLLYLTLCVLRWRALSSPLSREIALFSFSRRLMHSFRSKMRWNCCLLKSTFTHSISRLLYPYSRLIYFLLLFSSRLAILFTCRSLSLQLSPINGDAEWLIELPSLFISFLYTFFSFSLSLFPHLLPLSVTCLQVNCQTREQIKQLSFTEIGKTQYPPLSLLPCLFLEQRIICISLTWSLVSSEKVQMTPMMWSALCSFLCFAFLFTPLSLSLYLSSFTVLCFTLEAVRTIEHNHCCRWMWHFLSLSLSSHQTVHCTSASVSNLTLVTMGHQSDDGREHE